MLEMFEGSLTRFAGTTEYIPAYLDTLLIQIYAKNESSMNAEFLHGVCIQAIVGHCGGPLWDRTRHC